METLEKYLKDFIEGMLQADGFEQLQSFIVIKKEDLKLDLKSISENETLDDMKQAIFDLIDEINEI